MRDSLVASHPMDLPQEFLKRWLISINKDKEEATPEKIEEEMPNFITDVKWQLIKNQLVTEAEISIKPEDMIAAAKEFAKMQLQQFGMFNPPDEETTKWGMEILKNQEEARRLAEVELDKKLVDYFKKTIKLVNKEVTLEAFNEFFKN
jgi:trigger factor